MTELHGWPLVESKFNDNTLQRDLIMLMLGEHIGKGSFREVFRMQHDSQMVAKIELTGSSFHNVYEWQTWKRLEAIKSPAKKWFAPCVDISPNGAVLLQRFAEDVLDTELPEEVPAFFTDMAPRNWGRYKKQIVCRDYGYTRLLDIGAQAPMRKAEWKHQATKVHDP